MAFPRLLSRLVRGSARSHGHPLHIKATDRHAAIPKPNRLVIVSTFVLCLCVLVLFSEFQVPGGLVDVMGHEGGQRGVDLRQPQPCRRQRVRADLGCRTAEAVAPQHKRGGGGSHPEDAESSLMPM